MGKRGVLSFSEETYVSTYRAQFPVVSQQKRANHFLLVRD